MDFVFKLLPWYIMIISTVSVIICARDKKSAVKHRRRVPERTLMLLSFFGGGVAMYLTMRLIHHKTLHKKFMIGIPVIIVFHAALLVWLIVRFR